MDKGIDPITIQIFDDAKKDKADGLRPDAETIIHTASDEKRITLGTAIAGRGVDFKNVSYGIIAKPGLERVITQEAGRIGRDFDFGIVQEVYAQTDFPHFYTEFEKIRKSTESTEPKNACSVHSFFNQIKKEHELNWEEATLEKVNDGIRSSH